MRPAPDVPDNRCPACLAQPGEHCYSTTSDEPRPATHRLRRIAHAEKLERCAFCETIGWRPEGEQLIYIAEIVWFHENPVDGRDRLKVTTSLAAALQVHEDHAQGPLVATEVPPTALGSTYARSWAVHRPGTEPGDDGHLWIVAEPITA